MPSSDYFIRELEIQLNKCESTVLNLHQKTYGDVNCIVWDASLVLAKYLELQHLKTPGYFKKLRVLELGAGVGCVGLTAAILGAQVTLTDLPDALSIMQDNIAYNKQVMKQSHNQGSATASVFKWGDKVNLPMPNDLILLSDCVYYEESIKPLVQTLVDLCQDKTEILQCQEIRETERQKEIWNQYIKHLQEEFLVVEVPREDQHEDYRCTDIKLLKLSKK